ncbi:MAG: glycosyltransferase family 2 protein [Phycisphaerales bacterium]|nr:glycosyltransferase family 2 protein [Phycisphaerales bacterium]
MNTHDATAYHAPHSAPGDVVLSVVAPCFNEEGNIDSLVDRMVATFDSMNVSADLLLIDDGSRDATWERIAARVQGDSRVRGVKHETNRGIEGAWRSGMDAAAGCLVCLIDSDLQNRPEDVARLYRAYLRDVPDLVQAVRHPVRGLRRCRLFSRGLNFLLNTVFGMKLRDNKSGFVLARKAALAELLQHEGEYRYFQSFIGTAAGVRGYFITEVDTDFDQRRTGKSFLSRFPIVVSMRIVSEMFRYRAETWELSRKSRRPMDWFLTASLTDQTGAKA